MRRVSLIVSFAACSLLATLALPGVAFAGGYTWKLPADFTSAPPGSNPDHDNYNATPWSYDEGPGTITIGGPDPSTGPFTKLPQFSTTIQGGLHGWTDTFSPGLFVAENTSSSTIDSVPPGQLALNPSGGRAAAVGWTSPMPRAATVTVSGSVTADGSCSGNDPKWSLSTDGTTVQSGTGSGSLSGSVTVTPGQTIYLGVSYTGLLYNPTCAVTGVSLQITASQNDAPRLTLTSPANGALISGGQPTFAGTAATGFSASSQVIVRVYRGSTPTGTPVRTLITLRGANGAYSEGVGASLPDGTYTAVAEQDDLASPPDAGFSRPTSFVVSNVAATLTLNSPGTKPLRNASPTLTGTAATGSGDSSTVFVVVYPGPTTNAVPARRLSATRGANGRFSVKVTPGLRDGEYTAVAIQAGAKSTLTSKPRSFTIKVHAPALTLTEPAPGSKIQQQQPVFGGAAGHNVGDSETITVTVYRGARAHGKPVGKLVVNRKDDSSWSGTFPKPLKLGRYTATATQTDDAGHTSLTRPDTFVIVRGPSAIGSQVTMTRSGRATASVSITCLAPTGQTCTGTVLIVTSKKYQPVAGGPTGQVRVMFAYVTLAGSKTQVVSHAVSSDVASMLRRRAPLGVDVSASLTPSGGATSGYEAVRTLRLRS